MDFNTNKPKINNAAKYISEAIGCVLLLAMLLYLMMNAWYKPQNPVSESALLFRICGQIVIFILPAAWGVWMLRRSGIVFPTKTACSALYKDQTVIISSFGLIVILQMLYMSIFSSVKTSFDIFLAETPAQIFLLFLSASLVPAVAEEVLFRVFLIRSLRHFRKSLSVLISAIAFALMHFSVTGFPMFFVCGLILAMAYRATGSLAVSVSIHFLCNAFWFLAETVETYLPEYESLVMKGAFTVCVLLCVSGIPFLKENIRVFFEYDDKKFEPSAKIWSLPMSLFVLLATAIQLFFQ